MSLLAESGFRGVSLREALIHRESHNAWPERSVALTFDDGYANFYEVAATELTSRGFTATVFVVSGHVGGVNDWEPPPVGLGSRPMLSWSQLSELSSAGIEIGAHTRRHRDLRRLSTPEALDEICGSRSEIEDRVGRSVESFAYPFGYTNPDALEIVRREFRAACTTVLRRAGRDPLHELPRVDMYYLRAPRRLWRLLDGGLDRYLTIRRLARSARSFMASAYRI